jgi:hypothetical protein
VEEHPSNLRRAPVGKPSLTSRKGAKSRARSREDEAAGIDLRSWILELTKLHGGNLRLGNGGGQNFTTKLTSAKSVRVQDDITELPEGAEVTVHRRLRTMRKYWPSSSTQVLAVIIVRNIAGHQDRLIRVTMDGRARTRNLGPAD